MDYYVEIRYIGDSGESEAVWKDVVNVTSLDNIIYHGRNKIKKINKLIRQKKLEISKSINDEYCCLVHNFKRMHEHLPEDDD